MGQPLDSTRQNRFGQDALKEPRRFLTDMRELESAIEYLQDAVSEMRSSDKTQQLTEEITGLKLRIMELESRST